MAEEKDASDQSTIEELKNELEANPFNVSVISKLAQTQASKGDYNAACTLYEKLVRLDAENGLAWVALGHCHLLRGEYQKCFTSYQKALHTLQNNKDAQLWYGIGLLYTKFETYEYAEPAFQAVLRIDPDFEQKNEVLYKLGQVYKKTNDYENAISYLTNSMSGENVALSRRIDGLCQIGVCYEKQNKIDKAIETYREALSLDPQNFKTLEYLGWALAQNSLDGTEELKKALSYVGENTAEEGDIHYLLGRVAIENKRYVDSKEEFQHAIFKNPNSYAYWCSIGILYATALQPQDAFESFVKASNLAGDRDEIWLNMGILYEHCKQKPEAILAYERALSHQPNNETALRRKADLSRDPSIGNPPEYVHPEVEISEIPFSLQKQEKAAGAKQLPEIGVLTQMKVDGGDLPAIPQMNDGGNQTSVVINTLADKQGLFGNAIKKDPDQVQLPCTLQRTKSVEQAQPQKPTSQIQPSHNTRSASSGPVFKVTADTSRTAAKQMHAPAVAHPVVQPQVAMPMSMDPSGLPPGVVPMPPHQSYGMMQYYSPYVMPGQPGMPPGGPHMPSHMQSMPGASMAPQMGMMQPQMMPMMAMAPGQMQPGQMPPGAYPGFPQASGMNPYFGQMMFAPYMMPSYYPQYYQVPPNKAKQVEQPLIPQAEIVQELPQKIVQEKPKEEPLQEEETEEDEEEEEEEEEEEDDESDEDYEEYEFKKRRGGSTTETRSKRRHC